MSSIDSALSQLLASKESAVQSQIGFALAAKSLQASKDQGQAAVALLDAAAQIGKAVGRGENFDAVG